MTPTSSKMTLDVFGAALRITECAVILFEAQSLGPRPDPWHTRNYPPGLAGTVAEWAHRKHRLEGLDEDRSGMMNWGAHNGMDAEVIRGLLLGFPCTNQRHRAGTEPGRIGAWHDGQPFVRAVT